MEIKISSDGEGENIAVVIDTALGNRGGEVVINADGYIDIGGIINTGRLLNNTFVDNAGDVTFSSDSNIKVGGIGTTGSQASGKVNITGQNLVTGTILTQFEPLVSGVGGTVKIEALNTLLLGEISAEAVTVTGNLAMSNFTSLGVPIPTNLPTIANSKITTTQAQIYNGAVFLDDNTTFVGREISFKGGVDSFNLDNNIINLPDSEVIPTIVNNITQREGAIPRNVIIQGSQKIQLGDGIGDDRIGNIAGLASLTTTGATNININTPNDGISINTTEEQIYNNSVKLESDTILNSRNITFKGILTGDKNLTVNSNNNGITTFNSTVTGLSNLTTNADGTSRLNRNVTTTGFQNYQDNVEIGNSITLTTTNNNIIFEGTVNSELAENNNLTLGNGMGNIALNQDVGNTQSLGNIKINTTGNTVLNNVVANRLITNAEGKTILNGNVTTTGVQNYEDNVEIDNSITLTTTNSNITFQGTVNSILEETNNLVLNTGNANITFNQVIGNNQPLGDIIANSTKITRFNNGVNANSLTTNEGGTTRLNGNVTTAEDQVYNDNIFLEKTTIFDTNNLTAVSIEANLTSENPISVTINARDSVTITGKPAANTLLAISTARNNNKDTGHITIEANNDINLQGAVNTTATSGTSFATNAADVSLTSTNGDVSALAIASIGTETSGNVKISGNNINLGAILTFLTPSNVTSGNINIQGNNTTVLGTIQGLSFTTSGTFTLAENPTILALPNANLARLGKASVTTINNQNYNNFSVVNNANLNSTQGEINFTGSVNGNGNDLSIRSLTGVNFANQNFSSNGGNLVITTFNPSGEILLGTGNSNQFVVSNLDRANGFNSITIGQNRNLGSITVNENLTVNDPLTLQARNIFVNNTISGNDNASITLRGAKTTTTLNADIITQGNDITIDDNVILGNNVTLSTGDGSIGNINILGSINGNNNLTLNAGSSNISLTDNISLNSVSVTANNTIFDGNSITTTGNQNFNSNFTLTKNTNFNSQGTFSAQNISSNNTNIQVTAQNISSGNMITNGGNISLNSTNGGITTQNLNTSATTGGSIDINSNTTINTADIQTIGSNGNAGNVTLTAQNDLEINSINTSSNNGQGGDVNISTLGRLRVTDTIDNTNISINATGTNGGGAITIDFFPDNSQTGKTSDPRLPFVVGNPTSNGTAGIITNGEFSISPDQYFEVVEEGNINVRLLEPKPTQPPKPPTSVDTRREKLDILKTDGDTNNSIEPPPETPPQIATVLSSVVPITTISQGQEILTTIEREAAEKPAFIYVSFTPKGFQPRDLEEEFARREATNTQEYSRVDINKPNLQPTIAFKPAEDDQLDLLVITNKGEPIRVTVPVTRKQVVDSALNLSIELSSDRLDEQYKPYAKELYSWLITPIEETLKEREISNLLFILPLNIRFVPIASLYDEKTEQFLVEKYSSGLAPSLNLNDNTYRSLKDLNLLAMGASKFAEDQQQTPLPGVSVELPTIKTIWNETSSDNYQEFLNDNFTLETIKANLDKQPYGIIHFGTHGSFGADEDEDIFIQLYNSRLSFKDIGSLGLSRSGIELMLLSACQTALGNDIAELGFAGLAVQAGVKSAIGTVWTIGDTGTLAFMTDFYSQLKTQTTKAEALRQTQLNMLNGKVYKSDDGNTVITPNKSVSLEALPEDSRQPEDLSHPFYWAPFTLIGNPW